MKNENLLRIDLWPWNLTLTDKNRDVNHELKRVHFKEESFKSKILLFTHDAIRNNFEELLSHTFHCKMLFLRKSHLFSGISSHFPVNYSQKITDFSLMMTDIPSYWQYSDSPWQKWHFRWKMKICSDLTFDLEIWLWRSKIAMSTGCFWESTLRANF